ncbi:hypothetical protein JOM56_004606 [Amanita muscaria]
MFTLTSPPSLTTSVSSMSTITVRQTRDRYVANIEYIAYCKITLESNGDLNMKGMDIGMPGDEFFVQLQGGHDSWSWLTHGTIPAWQHEVFIGNTELGPTMTVVGELYVLFWIQLKLLTSSSEEINDARAALKRYKRKRRAERRAERIAVLKALFFRAGSWIASSFRTAASFKKHAIQVVLTEPLQLIHANLSAKGNAGYVGHTCVFQKEDSFYSS